MKKFAMGLLFVAVALLGCGEDKFTYSYEVNGCKTGEHSFKTKEEYCKALQDNALNNNCALSTRQSTFKNECSGTFTAVN